MTASFGKTVAQTGALIADKLSEEAKAWEIGGSQRRLLDSALNVLNTALRGRPVAEVVASVYLIKPSRHQTAIRAATTILQATKANNAMIF